VQKTQKLIETNSVTGKDAHTYTMISGAGVSILAFSVALTAFVHSVLTFEGAQTAMMWLESLKVQSTLHHLQCVAYQNVICLFLQLSETIHPGASMPCRHTCSSSPMQPLPYYNALSTSIASFYSLRHLLQHTANFFNLQHQVVSVGNGRTQLFATDYGLISWLDFCGSTMTCFAYRLEAERLTSAGVFSYYDTLLHMCPHTTVYVSHPLFGVRNAVTPQ
jgi:hypothetical protein